MLKGLAEESEVCTSHVLANRRQRPSERGILTANKAFVIIPKQKSYAAILAAMTAVIFSTGVHAAGSAVADDHHLRSLLREEIRFVKADAVIFIVSRKEERQFETPSASFVVSGDDIRRSGATSVPEALRMVPGLQVAKIYSSRWAVSARGFNDALSNKLLVLVDGRNLYSTVFSGVIWEAQDVFLDDVERIEIIRGPGATMWGSNAVNGVINIITKKAQHTQGGLVYAGGGNEELGFGGLRYGGQLSDRGFYRFYTKGFERDDLVDRNGKDTPFDSDGRQAGFRIDIEADADNTLTLMGDVFDIDSGQRAPLVTLANFGPPRSFEGDFDWTGGNVLGRWDKVVDTASDFKLQLYYDRQELRAHNPLLFDFNLDTIDVDFQHRTTVDRHQIIWGLGYRFTSHDFDNSFNRSYEPDNIDFNLYSAFVQNDVTLIDRHLHLVLGAKFEHHEFDDFDWQPSIRLLMTPSDRQTCWIAVARALRTTTVNEHEQRINSVVMRPPMADPLVTSTFPNENLKPEQLVAYEAGYRIQPFDRLTFDFAAFYNDYDNLRTLVDDGRFVEHIPPPRHTVEKETWRDDMEGDTYGVEVAVNWAATDWWRLDVAYGYLEMQLHDPSVDSRSAESEAAEGHSPEQSVSLRSYLDITATVALDVDIRYVDSLPKFNIPGYVSLDLRLAWSPADTVEIAVIGENLFDDHHPEFPFTPRGDIAEIERSVFAKVTYRF